MKMQRTFQGEKYIWWSVQSMLLQVRDPTNASNDLLLSLAERQITAYYASLRATAGRVPAAPTPSNGANGQKLLEGEANVQDKGKGRDVSGSDSPPTTESPKSPEALEFGSAHEFYLVTRFLELRVLQADVNAAAQAATTTVALAPKVSPAVTIPSLPAGAAPMTLRHTLLAHFTSPDANKWCERGLGLELWRRETELKYGSVEGGEWLASWNRLRQSLEQGCVLIAF